MPYFHLNVNATPSYDNEVPCSAGKQYVFLHQLIAEMFGWNFKSRGKHYLANSLIYTEMAKIQEMTKNMFVLIAISSNGGTSEI